MTAETSIYEYAKQSLELYKSKTALSFYGRDINYGCLFEKIDNVADNLYQFGVRCGTVVTIHLPNCPQAIISIYAVAKLGGICNMVHALTPPEAVKENMEYVESQVLITHSAELGGKASQVFLADVSYYMGLGYRVGYRLKKKRKRNKEVLRFEELIYKCDERVVIPEGSNLAQECAFYLNSSGSTGKPKTICLSHSAMNNCVANTVEFFEDDDMADQISLGVLPLFHGFGLAMDVHRNIASGSQLVLMARWNAASAVKLIKKYKVSLMVGVPTMYYDLLKQSKFQGKGISQLLRCYVGGDNVRPELIKEFDNRIGDGHHMYVGFGLTEATTTNCVNRYDHYKFESAGYPVRNTRIGVIDNEGNLLDKGEGELVISSKTLMMGYLKDEDATNKTLFWEDGKKWIRTGDQVRIDEEGFVYFESRIKDIIIRNGYNIYPDQIEEVIREIPDVENVCVVGIENEEYTQEIRAVVIVKSNQEKIKKMIRQKCVQKLPRYAIPSEIVFVQEFPKNAMGKVDRKELSER